MLGRKRRELKSLGRILTNREAFGYFRGDIAKNHKLHNVISHHCLPIEFVKKVGYSEPEVSQDEFASGLRRIDEFLNTESPDKQFGTSDVYDATKTNWGNLGKGPPGSRSKDNARTPNVSNWGSFAHQERGKGRRGKERNANITNGERNTEENEIDPEQERNETGTESMGEHWDVNCTGNGDESLIDLDWREVEN